MRGLSPSGWFLKKREKIFFPLFRVPSNKHNGVGAMRGGRVGRAEGSPFPARLTFCISLMPLYCGCILEGAVRTCAGCEATLARCRNRLSQQESLKKTSASGAVRLLGSRRWRAAG